MSKTQPAARQPKAVIIDRRTHKTPAKIIHNEVEAQYNRNAAQRDDREATTPEEDLQRSSHMGLPDGWRWAGGKVVPTTEALRDRLESINDFLANRDGREAEYEMVDKGCSINTLHTAVKRYYAQLKLINDYAAQGLVNSLLYNTISSAHFVDVYDKQIENLYDKDKLDPIEIKQRDSMKQALAASCALDALLDKDPDCAPQVDKAVYNFLVRQGEWVRDNFGQHKTRKAVKRNTLGSLAQRTRQPDEVLEDMEDSLDAMSAA